MVQFLTDDVILFDDDGVIAMDPACCCVGCDDMASFSEQFPVIVQYATGLECECETGDHEGTYDVSGPNHSGYFLDEEDCGGFFYNHLSSCDPFIGPIDTILSEVVIEVYCLTEGGCTFLRINCFIYATNVCSMLGSETIDMSDPNKPLSLDEDGRLIGTLDMPMTKHQCQFEYSGDCTLRLTWVDPEP